MQIRSLPRQVHRSNHIRGGVDNPSATAAPQRDVLFRRSIMPPFAPPRPCRAKSVPSARKRRPVRRNSRRGHCVGNENMLCQAVSPIGLRRNSVKTAEFCGKGLRIFIADHSRRLLDQQSPIEQFCAPLQPELLPIAVRSRAECFPETPIQDRQAKAVFTGDFTHVYFFMEPGFQFIPDLRDRRLGRPVCSGLRQQLNDLQSTTGQPMSNRLPGDSAAFRHA